MYFSRLCILAGERGVGRRGQIDRARGGAVPIITPKDAEPSLLLLDAAIQLQYTSPRRQ